LASESLPTLNNMALTLKLKGKKNKPKHVTEHLIGYLFIAPVFIGIAFFVIYPFFYSLISTFRNWNGLVPLEFAPKVGWEMYQRVLTEPLFWQSFLNTVITLSGIPIGMVLSMGLALLLNRGLKFTGTFRVIFYIPVVSSITAIIILWRAMMNTQGPINDLLLLFHIGPINFLGEPGYARASLIGMLIWKGLGTSTLLYLAGLQGISDSYKEAAKLDGANDWQIFWRITFPLLKPTHFFLVVTGIIGGMQLYVEPELLLNGGPARATTTILIYLFERFGANRISEASVVAWVLGVFVFIVTAIQFYYNSRRERA